MTGREHDRTLHRGRDHESSRRGQVRILLGYAPGVGKTSQLLREAHRLKRAGRDVAVAFVETRDRPETVSLLAGLEILPGREVVHRGVSVREMALAQVLERHPAVVVVDDAAHVNPPGFQHRCRYLDILAMADQGMDVLTAMDVLHVESLLESVRQTTGVTIRKSVPESFLLQAEEVILLDLAVEELLGRWQAGLLHPLDHRSNLLRSLFTRENLAFLRYTAMHECAGILERKTRMVTRLQRLRESLPQDPTPPRIMVCSVPALFPCSRSLVSFAWHLADSLGTAWFLVHIKAHGASPDPRREASLRELCALAEELGAETAILEATEPIDALLDFARSHGVGHLLAHHRATSSGGWWRCFVSHPLQRCMQEGREFHFHLFSMEDVAR